MSDTQSSWEARYAIIQREATQHFNGCANSCEKFLNTARIDLSGQTPATYAMASDEGLIAARRVLNSLKIGQLA